MLSEVINDLLRLVRARNIVDANVSAGVTERQRDRFADARATASDQRLLSFKQLENPPLRHHRLGKVVICLRKWHSRRSGFVFQDLHLDYLF